MSRATRALIDLAALQANLRRVRQLAPNSKVMAVIKANAYGHGIEHCARALRSADAFAVASVEEAERVRAAGLDNPVVLLEGAFAASDLEHAAERHFQLVVHSPEQLEWLQQWHGVPLSIWVKIDTGMNRLGFAPERIPAVREALENMPGVARPLQWMTHLANADLRDRETTARQLERFAVTVGDAPGPRSIANSAGTLDVPDAHVDWVRPGVMLYGVSPFPDTTGPEEGLQPVMTVSTRLIAVKTLKKGERVGYGGHFTAPEDMPLGIATIGYGDGYPRHAGNGTPVLVGGVRSALIGRVSMDMIALDLRNRPDSRVGDVVTVWGRGLPVEEVAAAAGTIPYELLCGVTQRVRFEIREVFDAATA